MKDYLEKILRQNVVINEAEYKKMLFMKRIAKESAGIKTISC